MSGELLGHPRARGADERARPGGRRADLARGRAGERAACRTSRGRAGTASGYSSRRPIPPTGAFRVPSPQASERRARADRRPGRRPDRRRRARRRGVLGGLRRGAAGDDLNAYLWRRPSAGSAANGAADGPAARGPGRDQGHLLHRGRADHGGLEDPRGLPAALHGDRGAQARSTPAPGCSARPTWTSSRWAPRTRTRATGRCQSLGPRSGSPGGHPAAPRPRSPRGSRRARSAPTPAARSASRRRCAGSSG